MVWWFVAAGLAVVASAIAYNGLVRSRERTREAWSGIDVQLRRRADLVPALVEVVAGYASHERETLEAVVEARAALMAESRPPPLAAADASLQSSLLCMLGLAEAYPELQAAEAFQHLHAELVGTEEKLAYSRQFYNRNVLDFNTRIRRVPTVLLARVLGLEPFEFFGAGSDFDGRPGP